MACLCHTFTPLLLSLVSELTSISGISVTQRYPIDSSFIFYPWSKVILTYENVLPLLVDVCLDSWYCISIMYT